MSLRSTPGIGEESFLLAELTAKGTKNLTEKKSKVPRYAASLSKVFLAAEFIRLLEQGKTKNREVEITKKDLVGYGTDILADLVGRKNYIKIDALTLMGLMIKYSCNSSTLILAKHFLPDRITLERSAKEFWALRNSKLISRNGKGLNSFSLSDFSRVFEEIYSQKGQHWDFLRNKLKTTRNIYYLFDQQELEILGSKSGTKKIGQKYFINDFGVFRLRNKTYFMGAMVSDKSISNAVIRIREIGRNLLSKIK